MKRLVLLALLIAAPVAAQPIEQVTLSYGPYVCDGVAHNQVPQWTSGATYRVKKISPRMGVDLYSTMDFQAAVYWIHAEGTTMVGVVQGDRAGYVGGTGTDRMVDAIEGFVVNPGDQFFLGSIYCNAFFPNPVFGFSAAQSRGEATAYIWLERLP